MNITNITVYNDNICYLWVYPNCNLALYYKLYKLENNRLKTVLIYSTRTRLT